MASPDPLQSPVSQQVVPGVLRAISRRVSSRLSLVLLTILVATVLSLHGLGHNAFWDDEANTALFARNWLRTGTLTAFDGVNVVGFRQGAELNGKLENIYMPPVQYYVAAAGLKLFDNSTVGARLPFVLAGLLSMGALALLVKWHLKGQVPPWVATSILALSPAYLMYIRQCRYYSIVILLTLTALLSLVHPKTTRKSRALGILIAMASAFLLMFTNYLNAVALAAVLPVFLLLRRYRTRTNGFLIGAIYGVMLLAGIHVLRTANPLTISVSYKDTITGLGRIGRLFYWHMVGLPRFEFFSVVAPAVLLVFFVLARSTRAIVLLRESLLLCVVIVLYSVTIVVFSPQTVTEYTKLADMRYVVALMPLGAVATASALGAVWLVTPVWGPTLSSFVGLVLVTTNLLTSAIGRWAPVRSTLYEYVRENAEDYETGNEAIIQFLRRLSRDYVIRVIPDYMTYPAMFYVPTQHYCCQLPDDFQSKTAGLVDVPAYVFNTRVLPDFILVGADLEPQAVIEQCQQLFGVDTYYLWGVTGADYHDSSRPEIPWHSFGPAKDGARGFAVLVRTGLRGP